MIRTPWRNIPQTMGTQHPDNAAAPYWEKDSDGFVSTQEEVIEAASTFQDLGCEEYMWDWEGKFVDESVIEKLLIEHREFFQRHPLGKKRFLTFRIPNIWQEKGRSLARAFMNILTSEEFARDINMHTPPLFEVILPMADDPQQLIQLHRMFADLARAKHAIFPGNGTLKHIELIPLIEGVEHMNTVDAFLSAYVSEYRKAFHRTPEYIRVFIARSDPAMMSGMIPAMIGNRVALSHLAQWSQRTGIATFPWIGAGSLPFRGFLSPDTVRTFTRTYPGCRSVSIQSAFRYDYPIDSVRLAIRNLHRELRLKTAVRYSSDEASHLVRIQKIAERAYQQSMMPHIDLITRVARDIPRRRERRLHIGLLGYGRSVRGAQLPRAISFTAAWYSIGIPPEVLGLHACMQELSDADKRMLARCLPTLPEHYAHALSYYNPQALDMLVQRYPLLKSVREDVEAAREYVGDVRSFVSSSLSAQHHAWTTAAVTQLLADESLTQSIVQSGLCRKSIG